MRQNSVRRRGAIACSEAAYRRPTTPYRAIAPDPGRRNIMNLKQSRLVTDDVQRLTRFYESVTGAKAESVYDVAANTGFVSVGITSDTAEFAVQSIRCWLERMGRQRYPS